MGLRTPEQYLDSLREQHPEVYARGEKIESVVDHPLFQATLTCWGTWIFRAAHDPELQRAVEPGTPTPKARLDLIRTFADAGFRVNVMVAPVIPYS